MNKNYDIECLNKIFTDKQSRYNKIKKKEFKGHLCSSDLLVKVMSSYPTSCWDIETEIYIDIL